MMWYWNGGWSWWGWVGMTITMLIFWGLVIWGIVALVRYYNAPRADAPSGREQEATPEGILATRFARGEIDEQEFTHKREVIRGDKQRDANGQQSNSTGTQDFEVIGRRSGE